MPKRDRDPELRFKRLEAAIRRINVELTALGTQLGALAARLDRVARGTENVAITDAKTLLSAARAGVTGPAGPPNTK
jgi:hypothetical protein